MDYKINYDAEASGPFVEGEILTFSGAGTAELVMLYDNGTTGEMYVSMISGSAPADNETITGGTSVATANVKGTPFLSRFPVHIREDTSYDVATGNIRWTGPNLGTTHSCKYDAEVTGPFTLNEILTFGNGSTAELVQLTDNGLTGILYFRMIDTVIPSDNDTITGGGSGATANIDGAVKTRAYTPLNLHYWYLDKGDDAIYNGDDEADRTSVRISKRVGVTDVELLGDANIDDIFSYHVYGGSMSQNKAGSEASYNAIAIQVVDKDGLTEPVIIQNNALLSSTTGEYWKNAYMPDSANKINMVIKTSSVGTDIDGKRVRLRSLEYQSSYFTSPDATLGNGITPVSLVTSNDGNNQTAIGTVATWIDAVFAYGFSNVDHSNGNGLQPYWAVGDLGSRDKGQFHERMKWTQRRGTAETIFGLNAALIVGNDLTITYDTELTGPFSEGETLTFGNGGTALLLALDDIGTTGTLYCQKLTGDVPVDNDTIAGATATAVINGVPVTRLITTNFVGTFTGSDFNPTNNGITLEAADSSSGDLFFDLTGSAQQPPNNQTGTINTTNNTVTCYPYDGSTLDAVGDPEPQFDFLVTDTILNGAAETTVSCTLTIPTWLPTTGKIRITLNSGIRRLVSYTSYTGSDFTIAPTDFTGDNVTIGNGVMPAPIDAEGLTNPSFTGVYTGNQEFVYKVTNGSGITPKQPNIGTTTFSSGGFSVNVNLQED